METLETLESHLGSLKEQFKNLHNINELPRRKAKAFSRHPHRVLFHFHSFTEAFLGIQAKVLEGWVFIPERYSAIQTPAGTFNVYLRKPQDVIDAELADLGKEIDKSYHEEIEAKKQDLLKQITETSLKIEEAAKYQTSQNKLDKAFQAKMEYFAKELASYEK